MMPENIQSYIQSDLKFSSSKLYFQHQNQLLQKIWFISPMSTDIHFKYTFQEVNSDYFIEWWEFEWLTVDHDVHEQWIIYKIWFLHPKFQNVEHLSLDLKKNRFDNPSIWPLVRWLLWWCLIFLLLFWLSSKFQFGKILFRLNIIWASILLMFYGWKISKVLHKKLFRTRNVDYGWFTVSYSNQTDALMLSSEVISVLKKLWDEYWVVKFSYTGNCVYLLQDIHDHEGNRLESTSKLYSEQEKSSLQQKTMGFIRQSEFLSQFSL